MTTSDDIVTGQWLTKHRITIPFKPGSYESETAWVKVDAHGIVVGAGEKDVSVLGFLVESGRLDEIHGYYANVYLDMHRYFKRQSDYTPNRLYALEFLGTSNGGELSGLYLRVSRAIGRDAKRMVDHATATRYHAANEPYILPHVAEYRIAFDALMRAIDAERKNKS